MATILICGDREWTDYLFIKRHVLDIPAGSLVIHGGCRGVDSLAGLAARTQGLSTQEFLADWHAYGKAAGPIRNKLMLEVGKPDLVWAFHDHLVLSRGTRGMMQMALDRGVPVYLFEHRGAHPTNWFGVNIDGCSGS